MVVAGSEPIGRDAIRTILADAMATLDPHRVTEALFEAVQLALSPTMTAVFTLRPDHAIELNHFAVAPGWAADGAPSFDFGWMEPLLGDAIPSGRSLIGPRLEGASQIAATVVTEVGVSTILLVAGHFPREDRAQAALADIAADSGSALELLLRSNQLVADNAALRERERLSRDLHDSLSQSLWSLSILAESAQERTDPSDELHDLVRRIAGISLATQEQMRSLLINLRTDEPTRTSIVRALEGTVAAFRADHDIDVVASIADIDLDAAPVTALQRITEEALNNVGRHAQARSVSVVLDPDPVTLRIRDDGRGILRTGAGGHLGLRIMEERAEEIGYSFELASSVNGGTTVTVCAEPERLRPCPAPQKKSTPPSLKKMLWSAGAAAMLFAASVGLLLASGAQQSDAADVDVELGVLDTTRTHIALSRASSDEATARVLAAMGVASTYDVFQAEAERDAVIAGAHQLLGPIAADDSRAGERATQVLDRLELASVIGIGGNRLAPLYWEASTPGLLVPSGRSYVTPIQSLTNLAALESMVAGALLEVAIGTYGIEPDAYPVPVTVEEFFLASLDTMQRSGGAFGPDQTEPLSGAVIPVDAAMVHEARVLADLNQAVVDAELWESDRWVREWTPSSGPPPLDLTTYARRSTGASAAFRAVIDERFDQLEAQLAAPRDASVRWASRLRALGFGALALAAVVGAWAMSLLVRRGSSMAADRATDPLTGVANRRGLDSDVEPRLADPAFTHHAMITVDVEQFRVINELYGRAFGDRLLRVMARGLESVVDHHPDIESTVLRLAGDEFLLSMHSTREIPVDDVRRSLDRVRGTLVSACDGTLVRCRFSYGLVTAEGSPDLDRMMSASDLARYEDESRRETARLNELTSSATSPGN